MDFYRVQADDGLGGAFQDVAVVAGTYTTVESGPCCFMGFSIQSHFLRIVVDGHEWWMTN